MTGTKSNKLKSFLIFLLVLLLSVSLAFAAACAKSDDDDDDETNYSKTETDEQEITNGNFEFGTSSADPEDFPYTSISGWTRAVDNSAASSKVDSGIVNTEEKAFGAAMDELIANSTFLDWAKNEYKARIDAEATEEKAKEELGESADSEAVEEWIDAKVNEIIKEEFENPGTHEGAEGTNVMMLNNYVSTLGKGTAQKVTSSTSLTLTPDTYGKITVWVKTGDMKPANNVGEGNYGANIRLSNTISSITQDEYSISDIDTEGKWEQYTFYVRANDFLDSTVKVVLGLGYGNGKTTNSDDFVEGTAYFDDVVYEEIETLPDGINFDNADTPTVKDESSSEKTEATVDADTKVALYDMNTDYFYSALTDFKTEAKQTDTNVGEGASNIPAGATFSSSQTADGFKVEQSKNSTSVKMTKADGKNFTVAPDSYTMISFKLSMSLSKLQRSGLTVYVHDVNGEDTNHQKALDNVIIEEDDTYTIIVKNNFKNPEDEPDKYPEREFYLEFIFGPVNVATTTDPSMYTTGSYTVSDLLWQAGSLDEESYTEDAEDDTNINYYNVYSLISNASGSGNTFALSAYAGWKSDYTDEDEEDAYSFTAAYSDKGRIESAPAKVSDYAGMEHYLTTYSSASSNPTAGLINTKYLDNYNNIDELKGLKEALDYDGKEGESAQPLMIYNKTAGAYGFASEAQTLAASSYATVSVRVRVTGGAAAYIYLASTKRGDELSVLKHAYTGNDGKEYSNPLAVKVTEDMMAKDGWATVNFYLASGKEDISYRLELWNGERVANENDEGQTSQGFVFFDDVSFGTSFDETTVLDDAVKNVLIDESDKVYYTRPLTEDEIEYNKDQKDDDDKISYKPGVVWASNLDENGGGWKEEAFVYAIYNTIDPVESTLPSDDETDDGSTGTGCADIDHSTFWLSLSSLLLGIALLAAIVMLIVKSVMKRRKARKSDAKAQYKITSRNKTNAAVRAKKEQAAKETPVYEPDADEAEPEAEEKEEYTYGDVLEDFGDEEESADKDDTVEEIDEPETIEENVEIKTDDEDKKE